MSSQYPHLWFPAEATYSLLLSECDSSHAMFLVFRVSFLVCIFSAMSAHIYFTVVSRLSSVRSGRARSTLTLKDQEWPNLGSLSYLV